MGKILVTKNNLSQFVDETSKTVVVQKNVILSPGIKDELREKNYKIIYAQDEMQLKYPIKRTTEEEVIAEKIRKILKEDYNTQDEELVKNIVLTISKIGGKL